MSKNNTYKDITVDPEEVAKFSAMAEEWWDENGKFKPLHKFNPLRIDYIRDMAAKHFNVDSDKHLAGLSILDIGCGGGLLAEPMAHLGANVTAIDASEKNIKIAKTHADEEGLEIDYRCITAEALLDLESGVDSEDSMSESANLPKGTAHGTNNNSANEGEQPIAEASQTALENKQSKPEQGQFKKFDIVLNMEVIEHVADVDAFLEASCALVKPGGLMFVATLNRTVKSYAFGIIGAEYILRWLPRGTHDWHKFLKPSEIEANIRKNGMSLKDLQGLSYNPAKDEFFATKDLSVNYIMLVEKNTDNK